MSKYVYATLFKWADEGEPEEDGLIAVALSKDFEELGELEEDICCLMLETNSLASEDEYHFSIPLGEKDNALAFLNEHSDLISHSKKFQEYLRGYGENGGAYGWEAD